MTCKDCVHYELCRDSGTLMYHSMKCGHLTENVESKCPFKKFKNKADYAEVKHGEWVRQKGRPEAICSECGRMVVYQNINNKWEFENYCPHCGAKMMEDTE